MYGVIIMNLNIVVKFTVDELTRFMTGIICILYSPVCIEFINPRGEGNTPPLFSFGDIMISEKNMCMRPRCGQWSDHKKYCSLSCSVKDHNAEARFHKLSREHQLYYFDCHINITECATRFEEGDVL